MYSVTVEYEAGELTYRDTIVARPRERAEQLIRAAEAPVSWSSDDPTDLRGEW
ncbi:hypothetical protein [Nocardiopsis listeri]|uniref:hypothetical protein n=1 Tax=Nocardiopsis listeri TaxID=53440 RepID=UPI000A503A4A|nr:hypothetical protein [Nocardiopsis listeri]